MSCEERVRCAEETVRICQVGHYVSPNGTKVELAASIRHAVEGTRVLGPEGMAGAAFSQRKVATRFEVIHESTFQALARLRDAASGHLACLNFASARNPGGGLLSGAQAQEEALARASGLYPCLQAAPEYEERNRSHRSALYLEFAVLDRSEDGQTFKAFRDGFAELQ